MKFVLSLAFTLIGSAAFAGSDCAAPEFAGTLICTQAQAAAGMKDDAQGAWIACGGACRVVQYPDRIAVEFDGSAQNIPGARFLHGNRASACLDTLPLVYDQDPARVALLRVDQANAAIRPGPQIDLDALEVFPDTARLSCDASRLIVQDVYGDGGVLIFDAKTGGAVTSPDGQAGWVLTSPDGSHALAQSGSSGGYDVVNLDTGTAMQVRAAHEIDLPAFGTDNSFALVRMTKAPARTEIYDTTSGTQTETLDTALPLGRPFARIGGALLSLADPSQQ